MQNNDWNIYKYVIAVAESGSALAAAQRLGVNGSTVVRRIKNFEDDRGVRLFERSHSGYTPTIECERIIKAARTVEENIAQIERSIAGQDLRLSGEISVTATDSFLETMLADIIVEFCRLHTSITVNIAVTNNRLNLSGQEADIALRASQNPPDHLTGVRVSALAFSVYGRRIDFEKAAKLSDQHFARYQWVGLGESLSRSPAATWMERHVPADRVSICADTFVAMRSCARQGGGLAVLPCFLGDDDPDMTRLADPIEEMETSLWVLTHPDVRKAAKVRAFTKHLSHRLRECRDQFEGS